MSSDVHNSRSSFTSYHASADVCIAVDGGERAVMYDRIQGVLPVAVTEGTHFRVPWLQNPAVMDIRTRPKVIQSVTGTKGMQKLLISC